MSAPSCSKAAVGLLATALLVSLLPTASASHEEDATLTIRQEMREGEECAVLFVEVRNADSAIIRVGIYAHGEGSAPDMQLVHEESVGTPNAAGSFDHTLGPYDREEDLDHRHTDLYVGVAWGEPGEHRIISEHFDLQCEDDEPSPTPPSPTQPPVCVDSLSAQALEGGAVQLTWDAVVENEGELEFYRIWRTTPDAPAHEQGEVLAEVHGTEFIDATAEPGVAYRYSVHAFGEASTSCGTVEVTAVPFFGAPVLLALGALGGVAAYAFHRRR